MMYGSSIQEKLEIGYKIGLILLMSIHFIYKTYL